MAFEEHHSPDGVLTFRIEEVDEGDIALGFTQGPWHTHAHFLVPTWGSTANEAVRAYTDALFCGEAIIAVRRKGDAIVEAWITEDPAFDIDMVCADETLEMRHWDGRPWVGAETSTS